MLQPKCVLLFKSRLCSFSAKIYLENKEIGETHVKHKVWEKKSQTDSDVLKIYLYGSLSSFSYIF